MATVQPVAELPRMFSVNARRVTLPLRQTDTDKSDCAISNTQCEIVLLGMLPWVITLVPEL